MNLTLYILNVKVDPGKAVSSLFWGINGGRKRGKSGGSRVDDKGRGS